MATARRKRKKSAAKKESGGGDGAVDYRSELWRMADALRGSMDAAIEANLKSLGFPAEPGEAS